ncbi:hypothetical protein LguiA_017952 [Lonicera macranthoides]
MSTAAGQMGNNNTSTGSFGSSSSCCAACAYKRKKQCSPGCIFAPYFPADRHTKAVFKIAHKFGMDRIAVICSTGGGSGPETAVMRLSWNEVERLCKVLDRRTERVLERKRRQDADYERRISRMEEIVQTPSSPETLIPDLAFLIGEMIDEKASCSGFGIPYERIVPGKWLVMHEWGTYKFETCEELLLKWGLEKLVYKDPKTEIRRDHKYAVQPPSVFATKVHMSENIVGKTTHKIEGRIMYYHYHGTISKR